MQTVTCPHCGAQFPQFSRSAAGATVCPSCHKQFAVPPASSSPPAPPSSKAKNPSTERPSDASSRFMVLVFISGFCLLAFVVSLLNLGGYSAESYANRFNPRYADSAAANPTEYIAWHSPSSSAASWLICFLLCWLIAVIERLRITLRP